MDRFIHPNEANEYKMSTWKPVSLFIIYRFNEAINILSKYGYELK